MWKIQWAAQLKWVKELFLGLTNRVDELRRSDDWDFLNETGMKIKAYYTRWLPLQNSFTEQLQKQTYDKDLSSDSEKIH